MASASRRCCAISISRSTAGKTTVVIGESGCGKTVLLKLIIGLLRPTVGRVTVRRQILVDLPERELTRQRLRFGYVFQRRGPVRFAERLRQRRLPPARAHQEDCKTRSPRQCESADARSGPCRESCCPRSRPSFRAASASASASPAPSIFGPEVMLYDEPTTGLDPIMTDVINELIMQTQDQAIR